MRGQHSTSGMGHALGGSLWASWRDAPLFLTLTVIREVFSRPVAVAHAIPPTNSQGGNHEADKTQQGDSRPVNRPWAL